jgi:hypothetical protein
MASQATNLQFLMNIVENLCQKWRIEVNLAKTNETLDGPKANLGSYLIVEL